MDQTTRDSGTSPPVRGTTPHEWWRAPSRGRPGSETLHDSSRKFLWLVRDPSATFGDGVRENAWSEGTPFALNVLVAHQRCQRRPENAYVQQFLLLLARYVAQRRGRRCL